MPLEIKEEEIRELEKELSEYAQKNGFVLNPDKQAREMIIKGLLVNQKRYGKRYCPCRRVSGNLEEDKKKICPCWWHKEEIEKEGHCHCRLFWKKDNFNKNENNSSDFRKGF